MVGMPSAVTSLRVLAPARLMTRSAATITTAAIIDVLPHIQQRAAEHKPLQLAGHMGPVALSGSVDVKWKESRPPAPAWKSPAIGRSWSRTHLDLYPRRRPQRLIVGIAQLSRPAALSGLKKSPPPDVPVTTTFSGCL